MKSIVILFAAVLLACGVMAADTKTAVFTVAPEMVCHNCETKIKNNLRFEKGVKRIVTSIPDKTVTIEYDPGKTNPETVAKGFKKIGYTATVIKMPADTIR